MKYLLVLLGVTAVAVSSLSAQSEGGSFHPGTQESAARKKAAIARAVKNHRCVYYITNENVTGSHLPVVLCRYEGNYYPLNGATMPSAIYSSSDIGITGSNNVGSALRALDPAISSVSGR